jgi:hypothetical protein
MTVSDKLMWLIRQRKIEILHVQKEVYTTITRMYDLD